MSFLFTKFLDFVGSWLGLFTDMQRGEGLEVIVLVQIVGILFSSYCSFPIGYFGSKKILSKYLEDFSHN